ncbi:hypothetical protein BO94DRAFT_115989 [Aspergillus sclerotioniger CBS 115572]|uniref:Uncharacterized protein n=1 Tax=Aspergillus sclerotioniger CBS 115572 TaxID=1450535 RepID=A0A317WC95_9EURO|nr:hypothetical protein BO94DRAFT_115989 [Aspergillus sclerotioniger CBS 115572]PWY83849.1 hypothetical protein BO94DRAFT_115989 [Aspergillus sclerotioniger CBS 115572]
MFITYSIQQWTAENTWLDEEIAHIDHVRTRSYDFSTTKTWVSAKDAHPAVQGKRRIYRHFVPRQVIVDALIEKILGEHMTRRQALRYLLNVTEALFIQPDAGLQETDGMNHIIAYNAWMTWAFEAIADWHGNMYLGYGRGDGRGTKIDIPCSPGDEDVLCAFQQYNRCVEYSLRLVCEVDTLAAFYVDQMAQYMNPVHRWRPGGKSYKSEDMLGDEYLRGKGILPLY